MALFLVLIGGSCLLYCQTGIFDWKWFLTNIIAIMATPKFDKFSISLKNWCKKQWSRFKI